MIKVLLTGATGFVGSRIAEKIVQDRSIILTKAVRATRHSNSDSEVVVDDLSSETDWSAALYEQKVVIHTAARAHVMKDELRDPLSEYRRINVEGTLKLARQSANFGVDRFIYISSIKVNGEQTPLESPFTTKDLPAPEDPYGISKLEAERGLREIAAESDMEVVVIRPTLVYGPGVKGNFASMIRLVNKGIPLPLGAIHNKRSLVAVDNLVDLTIRCIDHPAAANEAFMVSDGEDVSTTELLRRIAKAMGKPSRLVPVPESLLMLAATAIGKKSVAQRLLGSLRVDITRTRNLLGWQPPVSVDEGLRRCFAESDYTVNPPASKGSPFNKDSP